MALKIVYEVEDRSADKSTTEVKVAGNQVISNLNIFASGYATALNKIIGGIIRSATAYLNPDISSLVGNVASPFSDVENYAKFQFIALNGIRVELGIPAMDENLLGATTTDSIDQSQPDVAAFLAAMEDGLTVSGGDTIRPCDIGESPLENTVFAREAFRNSGKRR